MSLRTNNPAHLFRHWTQVEDRLRRSKKIVLFLDFDGTLVPIQRNRKAFLQHQSRSVLLRLVKNPRITVVAISGRRRPELRRLMGIRGIHYLGLYGSENGRMPAVAPSVKKALIQAYAAIRNELLKYPGIRMENKVGCFCVHMRECELTVQDRVQESVRALIHPFRRELHLFENLHDIEIVPRTMRGKGVAVRRILDSRSRLHSLPLYFGDDISDEPAFAELHSKLRAGIAVLVGGTRCTHAQFFLQNPKEVIETLSRVEEVLT
jgi:trehalose 6-phosphate phosphatase